MNTLDSGLKALLKFDVDALYKLATKLREGEGITKDLRKAARFYGLAALREESRSQYILGEMNLRGEAGEVNLGKALMWFNLAAGQGEPGALSNAVNIAKQLSTKENKEVKAQIAFFFEAKNLFLVAREGENPKAMNNLGVMYAAGRGIEQDIELAIAWFNSAIAQDYPDAYFNLGYAYEHGQGFDQDLPEAVRMYEIAADKGSANAQYYLAKLIEREKFRKMSEAIALYESAAMQGHLLAQLKLGDYFKTLDDPDASLQKNSKHSHDLTDDDHHSKAHHKTKHKKNSPNLMKAYKYFAMAAEQDDANSQCQAGLMAAQGLGTEQDFEQAAHWFKLAAKHGNGQAQFNLGFLYSHGQGVQEDLVEAYKWYRISHHCAYPHARHSLQLIEKKLDPGQLEMGIWKSDNFIYANLNNKEE